MVIIFFKKDLLTDAILGCKRERYGMINMVVNNQTYKKTQKPAIINQRCIQNPFGHPRWSLLQKEPTT